MAYAAAYGLGDTASWWGLSTQLDEVYLLRLKLSGLALQSPEQALEWARGVGTVAGKIPWNLDVRGVAVDGGGDSWTVEVVLTSTDSWKTIVGPSAQSWADDALALIRPSFPGAVVKQADLLQLTGPADAITHWRSQAVLWDHLTGKPTDAFVRPGDYSVVQGKVEDGSRARPWLVHKPELKPPGLIAADTVPYLGLAAIGIGAYFLLKPKRKAQ
jgi:hypothetical protein